MAAFRLLNEQGFPIGTVILEQKRLEDEIVNGAPELRLDYTTSLTNVLNFTLVVVPPSVEALEARSDQMGTTDG